jgi:hypothetical protein
MKEHAINGGPVVVQKSDGEQYLEKACKEVADFTSRMMACWSLTLNLLLKARGSLAEGEHYELRHGHLTVNNGRVVSFVIHVVYERYSEGKQVASVSCAVFDMLSKTWDPVRLSPIGYSTPDSPSWIGAQEAFGEVLQAFPWVEFWDK